MKLLRFIIILEVIQLSLNSCENKFLKPGNTQENAITISLPGKSWEATYPLLSAGFSSPKVSTYYGLYFSQDYYTSYPFHDKTASIIEISGSVKTHYFDLPRDPSGKPDMTQYFIELNDPGNINLIRINGLDETLSLGQCLEIKMKGGKYSGNNDKIKDVRFNAYQIAVNQDYETKLVDIAIDIFLADSGLITIRFANEPLLPDPSYY